MFKIIVIQFVVGLVGTAMVFGLWGPAAAISTAAGAVLVGLSLITSFWAWGRIFRQKTIALSISVIVFKYAVLGIILYILVNHPKVLVGWLAVGISSLLPTSLLAAWLLRNEDSLKIKE